MFQPFECSLQSSIVTFYFLKKFEEIFWLNVKFERNPRHQFQKCEKAANLQECQVSGKFRGTRIEKAMRKSCCEGQVAQQRMVAERGQEMKGLGMGESQVLGIEGVIK